jgi:hypothetical protein
MELGSVVCAVLVGLEQMCLNEMVREAIFNLD